MKYSFTFNKISQPNAKMLNWLNQVGSRFSCPDVVQVISVSFICLVMCYHNVSLTAWKRIFLSVQLAATTK